MSRNYMAERDLRWDEVNLAANEQEAFDANRQKIDEPKTPFHYLDEDGDHPEQSLRNPPQAAAARASGFLRDQGAAPQQLDLSAIASAALERREEAPTSPDDDPEGARPPQTRSQTALSPLTAFCSAAAEKKRKFDEHRKAHYNTGGLAAMRARAAQLAEEEEEEDDDDDE